jgi:hypothetical protein
MAEIFNDDLNVRLPFASDYNAFWDVCVASATIAPGTTIWFHFKKCFRAFFRQ